MTILYFAWLKERMGTGEEQLTLPEGISTMGQLIEYLKTEKPQFATLFSDGAKVLGAVNQDMATPDTPVKDSDEVAFFPPMTGG